MSGELVIVLLTAASELDLGTFLKGERHWILKISRCARQLRSLAYGALRGREKTARIFE